MSTVTSIMMSDIVPLRERGKFQGYLNILYAVGASIGAPLGGIIADRWSWRWAFLIQVPFCAVAFVAVFAVLNMPVSADKKPWQQQIKRVDFAGALTLLAAVFALTFGLDRGGNVGWQNTLTLATVGAAIPLGAFFFFVEMKLAAEPFAPGHIIFERSMFACYMCNFFSMASWLATIFFLPLYFQVIDGFSATKSSVLLIPCIIASVIGSLLGGIYMQKTGRYYWITVICYAVLTFGIVLIILTSGLLVNRLAGMVIGMCICAFSNGAGVTTTLIGLSKS